MGLYDRDYMRDDEPGFRRRGPSAPWSPAIALLVVLVVVFFVQVMFDVRRDPWFHDQFALSLTGIQEWKLWQFITFQFLHGGILHLALNGVALYSLGRLLERIIGRGKFLMLYFLSGVAGGLLQMAFSWLLQQPPGNPVVGASAGISGLLGAFILTFPEERLIVFPIPMPIRARALLWFILPFSILGTVFPNGYLFRGIAHAAHLGGLMAGGLFIRWLWTSGRNWNSGRSPHDGPLEIRRTPSPRDEAVEASKDEYIQREVDPILDKIRTQGIHSLTKREQKILEEASSKIKK